MKTNRSLSAGGFAAGISALFLAGFILLVIFGAQGYRNTVDSQNGNMQLRSLHAYLSTTLKAYDSRDAVSFREDPEFGPVLVLAESGTNYALRIYRKDGCLLEDYAAADALLKPELAQTIGETAVFEIVQDGGTLCLLTDAGRILFHARSGEALR